ncbi:S41 family peptidase [Patescibacteria group bacterium]
MKFPVLEKLKKFNIPKISFLNKINLAKVMVDKKKISIAITITVIVLIAILGRKSPFGNNWEDVLPAADVFEDKPQSINTENIYVAFFFEVYDLILGKFWNTLSEEQLGNITKLAMEKISEKTITENPTTRTSLAKLLENTLGELSDEEKKKFTVQVTDLVLANLEPFGRSRLYTSKKQKELADTVTNKAPRNHYEILETEKDASNEEVIIAYNKKLTELNTQQQTDEIIKEKEFLESAFEVVGDAGNRKVYDELGVNPTIENRLIGSNIFYIHITKFSPTTVDELQRVMQKVDQGQVLDTLIVDLRGNIGGAIDGLPYFLGPFIGPNQYAYQFFSRGEKQDFITKTGWLPSMIRYKKVVVLTDGEGQSSAEVFASVLKKYNVGVLVGEPTKGWGTVESVFKVNNQLDPENEEYSVLLVHSLTLRDDGVPIEGKGVEPHINTGTPNWERELNKYFNFPEITSAVRNLLNE